MSNQIKRFLADERGSMAMEFVIWVPYLMWWFVLSIGVFVAWDNQLSATLAAQTVTDIISRQPRSQVDQQFLNTVFSLNQRLLPQQSQRDGSLMRVSYLVLRAGGKVEVIQSEADGLEPLVVALHDSLQEALDSGQGGSSVIEPDIPVSLIPELNLNDAFYVVETYVPYEPISSYGLLEPLQWRNIKVVKSRAPGS